MFTRIAMNKKYDACCLALLFSLFFATQVDAAPPERAIVRWPAVAGINYPAEPEALLSEVRRLFDEADIPDVSTRLAAVIASPGPYRLAGAVSAHAFKSLRPGQYERVIILAPGHGPMFENCSIPAVDVFLTPLGPVALDAVAARHILYSPLFTAHNLRYGGGHSRDRIHEYEFAIESLLPFLQERLQEFRLVPILVGDLRDPEGDVRESVIAALADAIRPIVNERTLIVVSSSFTHYGKEYGNAPFSENIVENISRLDRIAFEHLLSRDLRGFRAYLNDTRNVIDGNLCIQILLKLLPEKAQARILAYETSAAMTNDTRRSVSYAAFTFHDTEQPALTAQPDKARPLVLRRPERIVTPPEDALPPEATFLEHSSDDEETPAPDASPEQE